MSFTREEIQEFQAEAEELLDQAEKSLLAIDQGGSLSGHYDPIFRALHSIKGAAGMMEMLDLQKHVHRLETILVEKKGAAQLPKGTLDLLLRGADAARSLLHGKSVSFNYDIAEAPAPAPTPAPKPTSAPAPSAVGKVLIVDDEAEVVKLLKEILETEGFQVVGTSEPTHVLQLIQDEMPDAVFTDIAMPELDGLTLLGKISQRHPDLPVCFVSAHASKKVLIQAIDHGVFSVIEKPFLPQRVIETALNAVRKSKLLGLLNRSVNLLLYQFSDLDGFLREQGKEDVRKVIETEMKQLLEQRRALRELKLKHSSSK